MCFVCFSAIENELKVYELSRLDKENGRWS
jgi:hypothetical protein